MATATAAQYRYVTLSHGKTRYLEEGTGHPVILIHGFPFHHSADSWWLNIGSLATRFRVLAVDCVGWGPSNYLDEPYSFAYLVDFIREFQDALGIESSHIVGTSMGGWIAGLLAYESPDRVDRLIQTGHNGIGARPNAGMTNWSGESDDEIREWLHRFLRANPPIDVEALIEERIQTAHSPGRFDAFAKMAHHMGDGDTRRRYDLKRRLPHLKVPTLYVWGKSDGTLPLSEEAKRLTPGSELVVLDCGHFVPSEVPEEFNEVALDFLTR
jgi:pimeloyl-ACP methyl ester carboxylesterase